MAETVAKTNATEDDTLTFWLRPGEDPPTRPTAVFLAIFTSDPGETGATTGEPATADGYARQSVTFGAPEDGVDTRVVKNTNEVVFGPASPTNAWGSITHVATCKSGVRGTQDLTYYGEMTTPRTVGQNQELAFAIGDMIIGEH